MTKPFSMAELLARLRAVLRRDDPGPAEVTEAAVGHCVIDLVAHTVTRRGQGTPPAAGTPAAGTPAAGMTTAEPAAAGTAADDADETAAAEEVVRLTPTEWRMPGEPGPPPGPAGQLPSAADGNLGARS